jgi:hypothetical protein
MACTILSPSSKSCYPFSITTAHAITPVITYHAANHLRIDTHDYMIAYLLFLFLVLPPSLQLTA